MIDMGMPARIRALRRKHNISRDRFASYMGVTPQTVYRWEAGLARPKPTLAKMEENITASKEGNRRLYEAWSPLTYKKGFYGNLPE